MTKSSILLTLLSMGLLGLSQLGTIQAFVVSPITMNTQSTSTTFINLNRRESIQTMIGVTAGGFIHKQAVYASGGATAGGSYLISAKQRYNNRVKDGIKKFVQLQSDLEKNNISSSIDYFTSEAVGFWKDTSTAGYLLANAFRTSSAKPPDSLPAVKKWKAFAGEVDKMQKFVGKNDIANASSSYKNARDLLDAYLEVVDLPISAEL